MIYESSDQRLQIRKKVQGSQVGGGSEPELGTSEIGYRLARDMGRVFGELHDVLTIEECGKSWDQARRKDF